VVSLILRKEASEGSRRWIRGSPGIVDLVDGDRVIVEVLSGIKSL